MGYIATNLSTISEGFNWYIFFLLDDWNDTFRQEVEKNFNTFARAVGPKCLAVQGGGDRETFNDDVVGFYNGAIASELSKLSARGGNLPLPALVVSNRSPQKMDDSSGIKDMSNAQVMIFPLTEKFIKPGSITEFLKDFASHLKTDSLDELTSREKAREKWSWLTRYFELKPCFFGVEVNVNQALEDLFKSAGSL
jgi:hypothetical protein